MLQKRLHSLSYGMCFSCIAELLILQPLLAGSLPHEPPVAAMSAGFTRPVFQDDFDNIDLDVRGDQPHTWYNGLWYGPPGSVEGINASSGFLTLVAPNSITTVPRNGNGGIVFRHGFFEARMRFSSADIDWSAFWLFSRAHSRGSDEGRWCEIDIFEHFGKGVFVGTAHDWTSSTHETNSNAYHRLDGEFNFSEWHNYSLLWTADKLTWFLDGIELMSAKSPAVCEAQDLFLIFGSQKHGQGDLIKLEIDWVRVFAN